MAELKISDLRSLNQLGSSLLFPADGDTETFNLSLNTLFEYTKERLGFLDTGSIEMYMGEVIPGTHTELDGKSFDPLIFPKMGALFPSGVLPDTRGMILKHAPSGRSILSFESESVKSHGHDGGYGLPHSHDRGTMEIKGSFTVHGNTSATNLAGATGALQVEGSLLDRYRLSNFADGAPSLRGINLIASNGWTGRTSEQRVSVIVPPSGSAKNLVDNIAVKFIIKKA